MSGQTLTDDSVHAMATEPAQFETSFSASGSSSQSQQPPPLPPATAAMSAATTTSTRSSARRQAQRRRSVFSLSGFPPGADPQQLLQQQQQVHRHQEVLPAQKPRSISLSLLDSSSVRPAQPVVHQLECSENLTEIAQPVAAPENNNREPGGSQQQSHQSSGASAVSQLSQKPRRSARSDTLGSTGSSRASSCDEPTILAVQPSLIGPSKTSSSSISSTGSSQPLNAALQRHQTAFAQVEAASSSSSSSLDSIGWGSAMQADAQSPSAPKQAGFDQANTCAAQQVSLTNQAVSTPEPEGSPAAAGPRVPPFQSIRSQLKRNLVPNAQFIQQHIENLITQNDAIIENWSPVNIRSYNSTRDSSSGTSNGNATAAANSLKRNPIRDPATSQGKQPTLVPSTKGSIVDTKSNPNQTQRPPQPVPSTKQVAHKRYSTVNMLATNIEEAEHQPDLNRLQTNEMSLRQAIERKRSYNLLQNTNHDCDQAGFLASLTELASNSGSNMEHSGLDSLPSVWATVTSLARQPVTLASQTNLSNHAPSITSSTKNKISNRSLFDIDRLLGTQGHMPNQHQLEPLQLENAIQNLSIKRKEDEPLNQHRQNKQQQQQQQHQSKQRQQQLPLHFHQVNQHTPQVVSSAENHIPSSASHQQPFYTQQNLISNQHLQPLTSLGINPSPDEHQLVAAALLLERQRQSLVEQTAFIRHQQQQHDMIERQLEQYRLAFSLDRQQRQLVGHQDHQHAASAGNPSHLSHPTLFMSQINQLGLQASSDHHHQQQHLQLQPAGPDNKPIKDMLSRIIDDQQRQINLLQQQKQVKPIVRASLANPTSSDNSTPTYRCDTCDVSFWTRDLLNYHLVTQCARIGSCLNGPLAFTFVNPTTSDSVNPNSHFEPQLQSRHPQPSKSVSPPKRISEPNCDSLTDFDASLIRTQQEFLVFQNMAAKLSQTDSELSILKRQLQNGDKPIVPSTFVENGVTRLESLPLKKRKISEPNMR